MFGGAAGVAYDSCYHQSCDTVGNINDTALAVDTGAMAVSALTYAFSSDLPGPDTRPAVTSSRTVRADRHDGGLTR